MTRIQHVSLLCTAFLLTACQTLPDQQPLVETNNETQKAKTTVTATPQTKKHQAPKVDEVAKISPAVSSLLSQANTQQQAGNHQAAISTLERAIRVAPRYPESYYRLASIHFQQGNYQQAATLAQKAISLGASGRLREQSLSLIANSSK